MSILLCILFYNVDDDTKMDELEDHLKFSNMKKNTAINPFACSDKPEGLRGDFVRKGEVVTTQPSSSFVRKGEVVTTEPSSSFSFLQVGDWSNYFSDSLAEEWRVWEEEMAEK